MYNIVIFSCCSLFLIYQPVLISGSTKKNLKKQYECNLDNVEIGLCKRVMNNTFLQQSYAGLKLKSEDDLIIAKRHTRQSLDLAAKMNHMHYWKHQKVEDGSLSPFADVDFKQNR